jgi:hypothetical protein
MLRFYTPHLTATSDNRFVLAWTRNLRETSSTTSAIYSAARSSSGAEVSPPVERASGGDAYYYTPALTGVDGGRAILAYGRSGAICAQGLNSNASVFAGEHCVTPLVGWGELPALVKLSNGRVLAAWTDWGGVPTQIEYAFLNAPNYDAWSGVMGLYRQGGGRDGNSYASVTADGGGRGILTWMAGNWGYMPNLYYALVDGGSGSVLTQPMIYRSAEPSNPYIVSSDLGNGNAPYSWTPPAGVDLALPLDGGSFGGEPGASAVIPVEVVNYGSDPAEGVVLTATLNGGVTYLGDTSGIAPSVNGDELIWQLPDLSFLERISFRLTLGVPPAATPGDLFSVSFAIASDAADVNPADNEAAGEVMAAHQVYLPCVEN